jgi:hypothetical protein
MLGFVSVFYSKEKELYDDVAYLCGSTLINFSHDHVDEFDALLLHPIVDWLVEPKSEATATSITFFNKHQIAGAGLWIILYVDITISTISNCRNGHNPTIFPESA